MTTFLWKYISVFYISTCLFSENKYTVIMGTDLIYHQCKSSVFMFFILLDSEHYTFLKGKAFHTC